MKIPALILSVFCLTCSLAAQADRKAIDFYIANFEKYLGREISVEVEKAERKDTGEHENVAIFELFTSGTREYGYAYAVVPKSEVGAFSKRYGAQTGGYLLDGNGRPLRGVFTKSPSAMENAYGSFARFYISYKGAVFPDDKRAKPDMPAN